MLKIIACIKISMPEIATKEKKIKDFEKILSLLKKERKISLIYLSKKTSLDFEKIKDLLAELDKKRAIKIVQPALGAPYLTIE